MSDIYLQLEDGTMFKIGKPKEIKIMHEDIKLPSLPSCYSDEFEIETPKCFKDSYSYLINILKGYDLRNVPFYKNNRKVSND